MGGTKIIKLPKSGASELNNFTLVSICHLVL